MIELDARLTEGQKAPLGTENGLAHNNTLSDPLNDPLNDPLDPEATVTVVRPWVWILGLIVLAVALASGWVRDLEARLDSGFNQPPQVVESQLTPTGLTDALAVSLRSPWPLAKKDLAALMSPKVLERPDPGLVEFTDLSGRRLFAETTLDATLQKQAQGWLKRTRAQKAALVVLNPFEGEVLVLASHGAAEGHNAAVSEVFPAASLFKIVTAAAAIETADYEVESEVAYDGGKHTLYKANVTKDPGVGRRKATLKEGFAESNNAVFGKVGAFDVGQKELADYAQRFHFNRPFDFELPVALSSFPRQDPEDLYRAAELASGFNRQTKTTALHGATLAAAVLANGELKEPYLLREVFDEDNNIFYRSQPKSLGQPINPATASELKELMEAAVEMGTGRRRFADIADHPLLSGLVIGGKTGTINNDEGLRVEWFVAYSYWPDPEVGPVWPLALSAVVVSEGRAALDSQALIRQALIAYYQPLLDGSLRVYR
ncbi:MAG: hypothetical protein LBS60_02295 [Deltaproteobacteria bacterium]|jgi:hypothetical protein|nr:hypothetical protein [Deltaproteobacteria bacterium]